MLFRLLRQFLRPYALLLWIVVVFQFVQAMASLYLPSLNADIIDKGVATGDTNYILSTGMLMIFVTLVQIAATITAVYFGARSAMSLGRDVRKAVFDRVAEYSEREVAQFGAPSLLTRTTNDVQQVQMLVLMGATMLVSAPILAVGGIVIAADDQHRNLRFQLTYLSKKPVKYGNCLRRRHGFVIDIPCDQDAVRPLFIDQFVNFVQYPLLIFQQ